MSGKTKLENYRRALSRLEEGLDQYDETIELTRDGLIQRFEFTFELAWKTIKATFEDEGLRGLNSPKTVLKEAFDAELISDESLWLSMLRDRNSTTHMYSVEAAVEICINIRERYVQVLARLLERLENRIDG